MRTTLGEFVIDYTGSDPRKGDDIIIYKSGKRVKSFNSISDDYAYTNAKDYVMRELRLEQKK